MQLTSEDKRILKQAVKHLKPFPRRYKHGEKAGQFIFKIAKMSGRKAKRRGFKIDSKGKPLDDKIIYDIPIANVVMEPFTFFMERLLPQEGPVTSEMLTKITDEFNIEWENTIKELSKVEKERKLETKSTTNN